MLFSLFDRQKNRRLLALAVPMILSNITVPLLGLVDTAVIGHLSDAWFLGGVALGSTIITLLFWLLAFLRMATTGLTAHAFGAGDSSKQQLVLLQSGLLALGLGMLLLVLQNPIWALADYLNNASPEVASYAKSYFLIRIWSAPFALLNLVLLGWLLGRQRPKAAMWQLIIANLANILLDLFLVLGLNLGVAGAALASVASDLLACGVAVYVVICELKQMPSIALTSILERLNLQGFAQLLRLNRDIFIRSLCLQGTFAFMTFKGAGISDEIVAANAVLLNLLLLIAYALDGIAYYAEAEVGQASGKGRDDEVKAAVSLAFGWSLVVACGFCLVFMVGGVQLVALLTNIASVRNTADSYLPWLTFMPLLAFGCYLFDGVYIGAAKGAVMRNSMLTASLGVFLPIWWLLQHWGNHGLWAALSGFMLARTLTLGGHYWVNRDHFISGKLVRQRS
ncbi:MATE family efflux transporter [Shewanella yunxiaonensis]|uniref:MATE family efflux transporter n=1 Tax=Shewanella yunxiaonensis TaxID=2829809 RepID=A0ABX7YTI4_9GAMM|nr:MATE family efflux transporter [Shewanella yunxiaonensis]QUN05969.1 MATE family efflux transporter [Shewanella yunxiaonensis]